LCSLFYCVVFFVLFCFYTVYALTKVVQLRDHQSRGAKWSIISSRSLDVSPLCV
jgi:hypothetical protein